MKHIQKKKIKLKLRLVNVFLIKTSFFSVYLSLLRSRSSRQKQTETKQAKNVGVGNYTFVDKL